MSAGLSHAPGAVGPATPARTTRRSLKVLSPHPVQYHAPVFRRLAAAGNDIELGYLGYGAAREAVHDPEFGVAFAWDVDLLAGYPYRVFHPSRAVAPAQVARWAVLDRRPLLLMGWSLPLLWGVWLARVTAGAPTVVVSETTPGSFGFAPKPRWRTALLGWLLRRSGAVACIGTRNRAFLRAMGVGDDRCVPVPYSVDNAGLAGAVERMTPARRDLRRQHGLDPDLPVLVFVGKLIDRKRPLELLDAYARAGLAGRAQLLYVGDGALREPLEARAREANLRGVRVLGFLNQTRIPLAYALGDVLCLLSDARETWGLVVNEALACGRPVIVSVAVGCADDLVDAENGWVVPLDDPVALAATLRAALAARDAWPEMGRRGRRRVAAHTYEAMAAGLETAIDVAAGAGR